MVGQDDAEVGRNLADLVRDAAGRDPDHPALLSGTNQLRWGELDAAVDRAAHALRGLDLDVGDRIALQVANTLDFPVLYFGALRAGLIAVPTNTGYTLPELSYLLDDAGAAALVTSSVGTIEQAADLRAQVPSLRHLLVAAPSGPDGTTPLPALLDGVAADAGPFEPVGAGEDIAVLMYTSGTSGRPRGAMLSHRALLANLTQCAAIRPPVVTGADVVLLVLPLFHVYGLNPGLGMVAYAGATGVLVERFDPAETLALLRRHRVTNVPGAPAMYTAWAEEADVTEAFGTVRLALSGAAPLPADTLARFTELGVPVWEGYGLTEAAPALTSTLIGGSGTKPGSVGRPIPGVELVLRDEDGDQVEVGDEDDDDPGEITVRGLNLFSGYWPDGADGPAGDGWYATGDVAFADDDGDLHLVDRRQELILVSGFNVYPAEVEAVLAAHPAVAEAAVIGVPDRRTGEGIRAYVVLEPGAAVSAEELLTYAGGSLARFKLPAAVEFVATLPHSATGKVSKARLREAAATA
jgi:long-chain acyl-CoA synthetase